MTLKKDKLLRFGTLVLAGVTVTSGLALAATPHLYQDFSPAPVQISSSADESGENGESDAASEGGDSGESGEAGEAGDDDGPLLDEEELLEELTYIRGHLWVGTALYRAGETQMAETHMKHPEDEIYGALEPTFDELGLPGFEDQLEALAEAVEHSMGADEVAAAYADVEAAVAAHSPHDLSDYETLTVIAKVVREAGAELSQALDDNGNVVEMHEYQDALGFLNVARLMAEDLANAGNNIAVVDQVRTDIDVSLAIFGGVVPPAFLEDDASVLYGAAARIELAALSLK